MSAAKKRKTEHDCRIFKDEWSWKYMFTSGLPGGILGYQIDPNLVSKLLVWYQLFLFGILQKFGIRCKQIWYPTRDLVSSVNSNFLLKKLIF